MDDQNKFRPDPTQMPEPQYRAPILEHTSYTPEQIVGPIDPTPEPAPIPVVDPTPVVEQEPQVTVDNSIFLADSSPAPAPISFVAPPTVSKSKKIWLFVLIGAVVFIGAFVLAIFVTAKQ